MGKKWLYKVAYKGWDFYGSQIQPSKRTVEGVLSKAFGGRCKFLSRTDKGVSARGNILVSEKKLKLGEYEGIVLWAETCVDAVPSVKFRHYRYVFPGKSKKDLMWLKKFEGTRDFSNYTRAKKNTVRTVKIVVGNGYVDFFSKGFLWNQIRRMVGNGRTSSPFPLILLNIVFDDEPNWKETGLLNKFKKEFEELKNKTEILSLLKV